MLRQLFLLALLTLFSSVTFAELVLGRAPQLSNIVTAKIWSPYVEYLSEKTGEKIRLKLYSERPEFEQDIHNGILDLFFGNPAYGVVGKLKHGYEPLVRSNKRSLKGIIVTRNESGINSVNDLKNSQIVFPSKTAFAATLYIQDQLDNVLKIPYQSVYSNTHDNVYRGVLIGKYPAGGGVRRTLNREPERVKKQLKIIYETPGVKPHPLMAHPRVSKKTQQAIIDATIELKHTEQGRKLLRKLKLRDPVRPSYADDYQSLEKLVHKVYDYLM